MFLLEVKRAGDGGGEGVVHGEGGVDSDAKGNLEVGIGYLREIGRCHSFAKRGIQTLRILAERWGVDFFVAFEDEVEEMGGDERGEGDEGLDVFSVNIGILDSLQKVKKVEDGDSLLFSPFPLQGVPVLKVEGEGFRIHDES